MPNPAVSLRIAASRRRAPPVGLPGRAVLCLAAALAACGEPAPTDEGADTLPDVAWESRYVDMEWRKLEDDRPVETLRADTALAYPDSLVAIRLELIQYDEQGEEELRIKAERGVRNRKTDETVAVGNVILTVPAEGRSLRTNRLWRDPRTGRIRSETYTVFRDADGVACGTRFESDLDLTNTELYDFRTGEANCPWPPRGGSG